MSGIDVHDLAQDNLPAGHFPVRHRAAFRLYLATEVHRGTWEHAKKDPSVEICGVLVGRWQRDDDGPYAVVTNFIPCESASSKFAEVTFTHESWAEINREMDTRFADARIIGWYHSHPDFGIFLSERDCFIHQHFFSSPGQIAYVIDPVRDLEGAFAWRDGKPALLPHYWVGESIRTAENSKQGRSHQPFSSDESVGISPPPRRQSLDLTMTLLSWMAIFLLGYLIAGLQTRWEREMIVEGTVAHYGFSKLMKLGLEDNLSQVRQQLSNLLAALNQMPQSTADLSEDEIEALAKQRMLIMNNLAVCERALGQIQQEYGLSNEERAALMKMITQKQAELRKMIETSSKKPSDASSEEGKPENKPVNVAPDLPAAQIKSPSTGSKTQTDPR